MKNIALFLAVLTFTVNAAGKKTPYKFAVGLQPIAKADTARLSVITGIERLGPNPLVIIDGVEHDKEILYKISSKCIRGNSVLNANNGGTKGKDGVVIIKTHNQKIIYLTANEKEYLINKQAFKGMFFSRFTYKTEDGTLRDEAGIKRANGGGATANLEPGGKIAFVINNKVYNEEEFKKLFPVDKAEYGKSLKVGPGISNAEERGINLDGYDLVFDFGSI